MANDSFLSLVTMGALVDSVVTIVGQQKATLLDLAPNGSSTEADFINAARSDGMYDLFAQKDGLEVKRARRLKQIMTGWSGKLPNLDIIASMISLARAHGVALTLVLTPHHADALELYWRNDLWPRVEQLKVALAALAAEQPGSVTLWDFLDYSSFNTEPVPRAGDRSTATRWYWEPSHFKKQFGEMMIQRMFGQDAPSLGERLTPDNVLARNALVRSQRQALVCDHHGGALLTALAMPMADGCDHAPKPPGAT